MCAYIKVPDLQDNALYRIEGRTASLGVWDQKRRVFQVANYTCGGFHLDAEKHWDDDPQYGTAQPLEYLEACPVLDEDEMLRYLLEKMKA